MARARLLKPGFFANDKLAEMHPHARLLFAGLWTLADREGRLPDRPKLIKGALFPYENVSVDKYLDALAASGFLERYEVGGSAYIQINHFLKHQQPHYKEPASEIPAPGGHVDSLYVGGAVPRDVRQEIYVRDGFRCVECGSADRISLDHIIPQSKGGTHAKENLRTLCIKCNSSKRNRDAALSSTQRQPTEAVPVPEAIAEPEADAVTPLPAAGARSVHPDLDVSEEAGFALEYIHRYEHKHARPPSPNEKAAARALERDFGTETCMQIAADHDWQRHPNWLREALNDPNRGRKLQATGSASRRSAGGSPSRDELVADWERYAAGES